MGMGVAFLAGLASRALVVLATPLSLSLVKRKAIERERLDKKLMIIKIPVYLLWQLDK